MSSAYRLASSDIIGRSVFYLAITAAILGYVLSHPLAPSLRIIALWTVIIITVLFTMAVGSVTWGLWTGVRDLQSAPETLSPDAFAQLGFCDDFLPALELFSGS